MAARAPDVAWTEQALADLTNEFGEIYAGRTVLVTGADGFMGSHLTDALCHLGADVHAFVRATSSGALNNIGHLRDAAERPLRRPDRQDVDRLPDPRAATGRSRTSSTSARRPTSASRGTARTRR